jgi:hypothetical protein
MARAPGDLHPASLGQKTMTHTVQCPQCGIVLNVPESAAGRKLKCPNCATKFSAPSFGPADSAVAESGPASSLIATRKGPPSSGELDLPPRAGSSGSIELPTSVPSKGRKKSDFDLPTPAPKKGVKVGDFDLPSSSAPLGDTYELPLLADDFPSKVPPKPHSAAPADALALFDDVPKPRKLSAAEAKAKARRCPTCGGVVGVGMSLCNTCGLDLDTGQRVAPLDVFDDEMPEVHREPMPPMGLLFVGTLSIAINLLLAIASLVASRSQGSGMLCLLVVWIFGIWASVQFLRRKSIRPLFLALGLGAAIGTVFLIAMPIWEANVGTDAPPSAQKSADPADPDAPVIHNLAEDLDMKRITWGIAMLLSYAALSVYLNSPSIKREFHKR